MLAMDTIVMVTSQTPTTNQLCGQRIGMDGMIVEDYFDSAISSHLVIIYFKILICSLFSSA